MPACPSMATLTPGGQETMVYQTVRCAMVNMRVSGVPVVAYMGGVAEASFPQVENVELDDLQPGTTFGVEWGDAFFYGEHLLLGPMHVRLRTGDALPAGVTTHGMVTSQAQAAPAGANAPPAGFFPALNVNSFYWRIELPRFGAVMDSEGALVNSAVIDTIPPFNTVYQLHDPVTFAVNRDKSYRFLSRAVPDVIIESCSVKLQELKHLNCTVVHDPEEDGEAIFQIYFKNESTEDSVLVSWMVWPRPEEGLDSAQGTVRLGRDPKSVALRLPRDIFYQERYLAASIAEPFETKGAVIALFPSMA